MHEADHHLDGNAVAGLLAEVFAFDVTTAQVICRDCGARGPVATLIAYGHTMGAILRCPGCDAVVIRVSKTDHGYWLDLRGTNVMHIGTTRPLMAPDEQRTTLG